VDQPETFRCIVVTPERAVLECEARFVALPAWDGEIGVLRNRAPLICKLGIGRLRVETPAERHVLFLDGGFAEMIDNRLTVLTEVARRPEELDRDEIEAGLEAARAIEVRDDESFAVRQAAMQRVREQRKMLQ
jgi:F-type H+-transporting ATPase subunit epsilon